MTNDEAAVLIAKGTTRYAGEWHLASCADEAQGMWCTDECAAARKSLAGIGIEVTCPEGKSWPSWGESLSLEATHG